jgi:hypothetical protein
MKSRCIECDEVFDDWGEHSSTKKHKQNVEVNFILRMMEGLSIDPERFIEIVRSRPKNNNHGRLIGPGD